jgi:ABC-2 type transport system ATP-binding protein
LGAVTRETLTLVLEVDGDASPLEARLREAGLVVSRDRHHVLVELADEGNDESVHRACDAIRDAAVELDVGLLRLERRRGRLEDLFAVSRA